MDADIFRWGCTAINWHVVHQTMNHLHHQNNSKGMSSLYFSSIKKHFF